MEITPADNQILGLTEQLYKSQARHSKNPDNRDAVTFNPSFEGYIAKALAAPTSESVDIEQIRKEMNAGQLDSPEAIRQTAQNILGYGV
jgi:hypothetical protein